MHMNRFEHWLPLCHRLDYGKRTLAMIARCKLEEPRHCATIVSVMQPVNIVDEEFHWPDNQETATLSNSSERDSCNSSFYPLQVAQHEGIVTR
jgi:hypothetical protein